MTFGGSLTAYGLAWELGVGVAAAAKPATDKHTHNYLHIIHMQSLALHSDIPDISWQSQWH